MAAIGLLAYQQGGIERLNADYATANNQRNSFTLPDPSELWLNSGSAVRLDFTSNKRVLILSQGELHLTTAIEPRPLQVAVPHGLLRATNNQFVVRNAGDHTLLQVINGRVLIEPQQSAVIPRHMRERSFNSIITRPNSSIGRYLITVAGLMVFFRSTTCH